MRVFITGGAGLIGRAVASHLLAHGHEVHLTDLVPETDAPHTTYAVCDILDFDAVREQMNGCDAVVHMAALRSPFQGTGQDVYRINTVGTFNVFEAAAKAGIRRVVQASSINAIGCAWNTIEFSPHYLPVDEDHPLYNTDPYSFSKQQVEEIGAYFWRRDKISSVAFRFPGVYKAGMLQTPQAEERRRNMRAFLDHFAALPDDERQRQLEIARRQCLKMRAERRMEYPYQHWEVPPTEGVDPLLLQAYTFDRFNLWVWIDERDAALAVAQALTANYEGAHPLFVNHTQNFLNYSSQTLARLFFPEVTDWKTALTGAEAMVSIQRARELIGFEPQHAIYGDQHA
jgi:hypothetical protein